MPRLFTGIELPETHRDALMDLQAPLPGASWIEADNLHLTLRFAGDLDNRQADELFTALSGIHTPAFEMRIVGLGAFGGSDPRVLWAGVEGGEPLEMLARAHERAARAAGLAPEPRPFKPHITLARLRHTRIDALARYMQHHGALKLEPFMVERFVLYSSRPRVGGGPYVIEESFPLIGGRPADEDEHFDQRW